MPNSDAASKLNTRPSDHAAHHVLPYHDLSTSKSLSDQHGSHSPRYIPEIGDEAGFATDQAFGSHEVGHKTGSSSSDADGEIQVGEDSSGPNSSVAASASAVVYNLNQEKRKSELTNGLSFISPPAKKEPSPDSLQHAHMGYEPKDPSEPQDFDQGFDSQQGEQMLPGLGSLSRTNSFPAVPPLHQTRGGQSQVHAQSQVESILEEDEHTSNAAQSSFDTHEPQNNTITTYPDQRGLLEDAGDLEEDDFFGHPNGAESGSYSFSPADDEARFEEGLPLVHSVSFSAKKNTSPIEPDTSLGLSSSHQNHNDEDFFGSESKPVQEASFFKPKILDRKTTNQVLDGMSYPSYNATHGAPHDQTSSTSAVWDSIGIAGNTMASDSGAESSRAESGSPPLPASHKEEDLAALWQAALDDDDLLDDSEAPEGQPTPSAKLEPTMNTQAPLLPNSQSIYGADGRKEDYGSTTANPRSTSPSSQNRYSPAPSQQTTTSPFYPSQTLAGQHSQVPSTQYLSHSSSAPVGFGQMAGQEPEANSVPGRARPGMPKPTQSFADKSKEGYTSPYDLPMDVSRPKRRTNLQQVQTLSSSQSLSRPPAPPRSSSMYVSGPPADGLSPPLPPLPGVNASLPAVRPLSSSVKAKASEGSFFEELPSTKSRPQSSAGRYAPAAPQQQAAHLPSRSEPPRQPLLTHRPPSNPSSTTSNYQLVPPERQSPYANLPHQDRTKTNSAPAQANARYSPTPRSQSNVPPPRNRYAASPAAVPRPPASSQTIPFQPRTSSPLAQNPTFSQQSHDHSSPPTSEVQERPRIPQRVATNQRHDPHFHSPGMPQVEERFDPSVGRNVPGTAVKGSFSESRSAQENLSSETHLGYSQIQSSPSNSGFSALTPDSEAVSTSPGAHSQYPNEPQGQSRTSPGDGNIGPIRRPQTQSPGVTRPKPDALNRAKDVHQRPASAIGGSYGHAEPSASSHYAPSTQSGHSSTQDLNYIRPTDGREHDPLERWKGAPILKFGFGGTIVTSFPKHIPRYAAGHGFPMIKCSSGEVKLQIGNRGTIQDDIASFPGPLKSKSKKKELVEWLGKKIQSLEQAQASVVPSSMLPDPVKRHEEKVLLWRMMRIFVEHDGNVTRNSEAEDAVRAILCPELAESEGTEASLAGFVGGLAGISKLDGSQSVVEPVDSSAMESVRRLLLQGEREKAVWHAVDRRMWAHAMVLASTLDKSIWKQVLHEFTRLEVRPFGENTESLAALYEVFAGNWEDSIDELVPPSARAGLQMVSKAAATGPTRNALDGLDRWRETLSLILSNRTQDDENALVALGRLLAGYSRVEAAHLCFVFAKSTGLFGGTEDAQASVALLGADHQQQPFDYGRDLDSILLTEVYEFARSVLTSSASLSVSPHLQSYKLYHAMLLAESGHRSEAQQYCDAIMSTLKSTTKPSPYYHNLLFTALDDLVERLQQAPRDGSSWMSKPMDKMSGSMWKRFNNFIVGDESDTGSVSSGKGDPDVGPFAKVAADAPTISRSGSSADLYGALGSSTVPAMPATTASGSRYAPSSYYAPSGQYTPRASLEQQGRPSEGLQRPVQPSMLRPAQTPHPYPSNPSRYTSSPAVQQENLGQQYKPAYQYSPYDLPRPESYLPTPPSQPEYMPSVPSEDSSSSQYPPESLQTSAPSEVQVSHSHPPNPDNRLSDTYEPPVSAYDSTTSGYEPPSSYVPYEPEAQGNQSPTGHVSRKEKKSFLDDGDEDDFEARAAELLKDDRAQKDREANEAFRKAAEADAQKDLKPKKSGWFSGVGGWLGGKKGDDLSSQEPKAIKAKLGEESSFYYDKELKKWVNKKGPAPATSEAPKAPPPRGPPSRAVSGAGGPPITNSAFRTSTPPVPPLPSMVAAHTGTPPVNASQAMPPTNLHQSQPASGTGTPARTTSPAPTAGDANDRAPPTGLPSAPPSRPSTAAGGGGSIDDLLGEPQARKGGTVRRGKKGRGYVDVMAK
ncbi:MAG: hypothetical protein Q9166_001397 [cf. Caloplaca sp. 2 TL-2023]